jgi:hypothetical protein
MSLADGVKTKVGNPDKTKHLTIHFSLPSGQKVSDFAFAKLVRSRGHAAISTKKRVDVCALSLLVPFLGFGKQHSFTVAETIPFATLMKAFCVAGLTVSRWVTRSHNTQRTHVSIRLIPSCYSLHATNIIYPLSPLLFISLTS